MPRRSIFILTMLALIVSAIFAAPATARGQEQQTSLQINQVDASAYPTIRAVVSATGADGLPVAGLTAAAFQPSEGDTAIPLTGVTPASDPDMRLGVVIAIDVSAGMAGAPLDAAKLAATAFVLGLRPADEAALVAYNDTVTGVVGFTVDKNALVAGIDGLEARGGSSLYEAAQTSAFAVGTTTTPRRAVVLLSGSGNSAASEVTATAALAVAQSVGAPVFTIAQGAGADETFLNSLAAVTMGQARGTSVDGIALSYTAIKSVLDGQYVLTMTGGGAADGQVEELRIIAEIAGAPAGAVAPFRRGLDSSSLPGPETDDGGSEIARIGLIALLVVVATGAVLGVAYGVLTFLRRLALERRQRAVVAPNFQRAAAQGLPRQEGAYRSTGANAPSMSGPAPIGEPPGSERAPASNGDGGGVDHAPQPAIVSPPALIVEHGELRTSVEQRAPAEQETPVQPTPAPMPTPAANLGTMAGTNGEAATVRPAPSQPAAAAPSAGAGRFIERTPQGRGATYELGGGPIVIGSSARECTIVLPESPDVAPAHVRIWLRDGKYTMHHAGGFRRRTLVGGEPTDWCVLEHGDEVQVGSHRLVYEEDGHERKLRF